eukprot:2564346-Pyramimonas_sp.AAC.1
MPPGASKNSATHSLVTLYAGTLYTVGSTSSVSEGRVIERGSPLQQMNRCCSTRSADRRRPPR